MFIQMTLTFTFLLRMSSDLLWNYRGVSWVSLCCDVLYCVVLWCAVLCCVVLCCAVLCYFVLCCAVLC